MFSNVAVSSASLSKDGPLVLVLFILILSCILPLIVTPPCCTHKFSTTLGDVLVTVLVSLT
jgi:hypothetical protein